jgi:putative ABC transport system permease protein
MSLWTMLLREIAHRKLNTLIGLLGVVASTACLVGVLLSLEMHEARTEAIVRRKEAETRAARKALESHVRNAMHRLGYNAIVLPQDQPLGDWYADDYARHLMPEAWCARLDETQQLVDRYLPRLRRKIDWAERKWTIIVVGVGEERILDTSVCSPVPLVDPTPPGSCVLGYELHTAWDLHVGDVITVQGTQFTVDRCAKELGTKDDITLELNLADAQKLAGQPGKINEILLVEHLSVWGRLEEVQRRIAEVLPECQVVEIASETLSRAHARIKVAEEAQAAVGRERERRARLQAERARIVRRFVPLGLSLCALWVTIQMYLNVRDRAQEIGVLMAQGFRARAVGHLIYAKAIVQGIAGGVIGFIVGGSTAVAFQHTWTGIAALHAATVFEYFGMAVVMSAIACLLGSWLPASLAVRMDPAVVLRHER